MSKHSYRVERHMLGDKPYAPGDARELEPGEAAHMVRTGALTDLGPVKAEAEPKAEKAEAKPKNKADAPVENKST